MTTYPQKTSRPLTKPSKAHIAKKLDPDINPWERQPTETDQAWNAFLEYRDADDRKVGSGTNRLWSSRWSWGYRAFEYDRYLQAKDVEDAVRYRRKMNDRQRRAASLAQQKVIQWLVNMDPSKLTAGEAARWFEVAVKVERLAGGDPTERVSVAGIGTVDDMGAEEVSSALAGLQTEINRMLSQKDKLEA